jgi:hypothetical protein
MRALRAGIWVYAAVIAACGGLEHVDTGATSNDAGSDGPSMSVDASDGPDSDGPSVSLDASDGPDAAPTPRDASAGDVDDHDVPPGCTQDGWCSTNPLDGGIQDDLVSVWQSSPTDVWALGGSGALFHFDGFTWSAWKGSDGGQPNIGSDMGYGGYFNFPIWGASSSDVWACEGSSPFHYDGSRWDPDESPVDAGGAESSYGECDAVGGTGPSDVWMLVDLGAPVGPYSGAVHWNGNTWDAPSAAKITAGLMGLWSPAPGEFWTISYFNQQSTPPWGVEHWNGATLTHEDIGLSTHPVGPPAPVEDLWGTSDSDVWAVGAQGAIVHRDATKWSKVPTPSQVDWHAVRAVASNRAWIAGSEGAIAHWTGTQFVPMVTGTTSTIFAFWADGMTQWAVGAGGLALRRQGP